MHPIEIEFYTTLGCHLCDAARQVILDVGQTVPIAVDEIDIVESEALMMRYGIRIPVIRCVSTGRELGWPFGRDELRSFLILGKPSSSESRRHSQGNLQ